MTDDNAIMVPQVNMNGTSRDSLLAINTAALQALRHARDLLHDAAPHGRDFQTLPGGSYEQARDEHIRRVLAVEQAMVELSHIVEVLTENRRRGRPPSRAQEGQMT